MIYVCFILSNNYTCRTSIKVLKVFTEYVKTDDVAGQGALERRETGQCKKQRMRLII